MATLTSTAEIIDLLGGNIGVAHLTSTTSKAVSNWRVANKFPANTYLILTDALALHDKTAPDELWAMRSITEPARKKQKS